MMAVVWVALGGALGSVARYGAGVSAARLFGLAFPWGTLIINVVGGIVMGVFAARTHPDNESLRLFFGVGVWCGFTTFSTFSLESVRLLETQPPLAALYMLASVLLSVGGCWAGLALGRL